MYEKTRSKRHMHKGKHWVPRGNKLLERKPVQKMLDDWYQRSHHPQRFPREFFNEQGVLLKELGRIPDPSEFWKNVRKHFAAAGVVWTTEELIIWSVK